MSYPKYQKMQEDVPISPPYLENHPSLPKIPTESTHCVELEGSPGGPPQDLFVCGPNRTASKHIPHCQQPQSIIVVPVQLTEEPDYMGYSIITMLCCFLPLGIAAFVCSRLTQRANHKGDIAAARRYSRAAVILGHISVGIGLLIIILYFFFFKI